MSKANALLLLIFLNWYMY